MKNRQNYIHLLFLVSSVILIQCKSSDPTLEVPKTIHLVETNKLESNEVLDFITNFQFSKDETIWLGTFNSGLYHISGNSVVNFNTTNSPLPDDRINDLFIDHLNRVWVATDNGFAMYQKDTWELYTIENTPLIAAHVSQVAINDRDEILIGNGSAIEGGLLLRDQNGNWKEYTTENSTLPCNFILEIELSNDGGFWVSTGQLLGQGGVIKFENDKIIDVLNIQTSGLLYNWVDNIEVSDNNLWTGFEVRIYNESGFPEGGIQRIDLQSNSTVSYFPQSTGLVSNRITAMKLHSDNSLWFATSIEDPACENCNAGIGILFEDGEFLVTSATSNPNILPNAFFPKLNEDNSGNMYIASELSLYRLELSQ